MCVSREKRAKHGAVKQKSLPIIMLAALCLTALTGCSSATLYDKGLESDEVLELLESEDTEEGYYELETGATLPAEDLINDSDSGLVMRVTGLSGTLHYPRVNLVFEKGKYTYLYLDIDYMIINGWQVTGSEHAPDEYMLTFANMSKYYSKFPAYIAAGTGELEEAGFMDDVYTIDIHFNLSTLTTDGGDSWDILYSKETSAAKDGDYDLSYECDGEVLADIAGVKFQMLDLDESGVMTMYVENNSDQRVTVVGSDPTHNGKQMRLALQCDILPGLRRYGQAFFTLRDNVEALEEGDEVAFRFSVYDYDAYQDYNIYDEEATPPDPIAETEISIIYGESSAA